MALSITALFSPVTREQALNTLLGFLKDLGFATTSWQPGSVQRTIVTACAWVFADATTVVTNLAKGGYASTATGQWADLLGEQWFDEDRTAAVRAEGTVTLTSASGSPPHSWAANELLFAENSDGTGAQYRNTASGSITASSTLDINVKAILTGRAANINAGSTPRTLYLMTPLSGVTATIQDDPASGTWLVTPGEDEESDERYMARCVAKWGTLTYGSGTLAYKRWVYEADPTVTRVTVIQGENAAEVRVICATSEGGISGAQITAISDYIEDGRRPINDVVSVESATPVNVTITAAPVVTKGVITQAQIEAAIESYFSELPIGGKIIYPSTTGAVIYDDVVETILALNGVLRARVTAPSADYALASEAVAIPVFDLTVTEVVPTR